MLEIAVCDDEEYFCAQEKQLISQYMKNSGCEYSIDLFRSGEELLARGEALKRYRMIFLDIDMEEIDGIETAREIRKQNAGDVYIVFVTAFITYALDGYKVGAIRYLLKNDDSFEKQMQECLEAIFQKIGEGEKRVSFSFLEGEKLIPLNEMIYIESNLHKLIFHMTGDQNVTYTMNAKLDEIDRLLQGMGFCRIHKSYLVNFRYVKRIERYNALLFNGKSLGISKARYLDARNEFTSYWSDL